MFLIFKILLLLLYQFINSELKERNVEDEIKRYGKYAHRLLANFNIGTFELIRGRSDKRWLKMRKFFQSTSIK